MAGILLLGDSHVGAYDLHSCRRVFPFKRKLYPAGSAMGLANKQSATGYRQQVTDFLAANRNFECFAFNFGQVDIDFVYYYKLCNNPAYAAAEFVEYSLDKYFSFLAELVEQKLILPRQTIIHGINPPSIDDERIYHRVINLHTVSAEKWNELNLKLQRLKLPDLRRRTSYSELYDRRLGQRARNSGYKFLDIFPHFIDPQSRTLHSRFYSSKSHHLCLETTAPVIRRLYDEFIAFNL